MKDPLLVVFGSFLPSSNVKQNKTKNVVKIGGPLTKLSGSTHEISKMAKMAAILKFFKRHTLYPSKPYVRSKRNFVGGIGATSRLRFAK